MLVLSLGLLSALLPAKIAGAIFYFEPILFRTGSFSLSAPRSPAVLRTRAPTKLRFSFLGMRVNAGSFADAHRLTSPGKADGLPDAFGRQLLWYTKCGDSCNSPEACESPCYCQLNSTGGASQKGNSQAQDMWGTCRPQSGLLLLLFLWCYRDPLPPHVACGNTQGGLSSCCVLFSMSIVVDAMEAKANQQLGVVSTCTADCKKHESLMIIIVVQVQPAWQVRSVLESGHELCIFSRTACYLA